MSGVLFKVVLTTNRSLLSGCNKLHKVLQLSRGFSCTSVAMAGKNVTFKTENKLGDGCGVMYGDPAQIKKGVIVIQEWWGMNEQIKKETEEISKDGCFVTLTPDLYRGKVAIDAEMAEHYMGNLDWPGAVADIKGAILFLKSQGCSKVGVTGFCMGGALSLAAAALLSEVDASAPFYGTPSKELCDLSKIKCPVQCHFGNKDEIEGFSAPKDADALEKTLKDAGVNFEFYRYDAGHAFTHKDGPLGTYNEEICKQALNRLYQFMQKYLS